MLGSLADPRTLLLAVVVEAALAPVGLLVCWFFRVPVAPQFPSPGGLPGWTLAGLLATAPLLAALAAVLRARWAPLARLREESQRVAAHLLLGVGIGPLVAVSLAAGLGEEVLFRGALQPLLGSWLGAWGGVVGAAALFGFAHPISREYMALAMLIGLYLGGLTLLTGNLVPAIVAHAAYDFVALCWLRNRMPEAQASETV
ncbi:MAG: CPBP family intramembrane metalloprotease [Planctomycetales bacterium]|nr:CPBP family intramembrane metalloprotease [Planctomycetales bacterium]